MGAPGRHARPERWNAVRCGSVRDREILASCRRAMCHMPFVWQIFLPSILLRRKGLAFFVFIACIKLLISLIRGGDGVCG